MRLAFATALIFVTAGAIACGGNSPSRGTKDVLHLDGYDATTEQVRERVRAALEDNPSICGVFSSFETLAAIADFAPMAYQDFIETLSSVKGETPPTPVGAVAKPGQSANVTDELVVEQIYADECARLSTAGPSSGWSAYNHSILINGCEDDYPEATCSCLADHVEQHVDESVWNAWLASDASTLSKIVTDATTEGLRQCAATPTEPPMDAPVEPSIAACQLITSEEITSILGGNWDNGYDYGGGPLCVFTGENGLFVKIFASNFVFDMQLFETLHATLGDTPIAGVGNSAYWSKERGVNVLIGSTGVEIKVTVGPAGFPDETKSKSIAQVVANNLSTTR